MWETRCAALLDTFRTCHSCAEARKQEIRIRLQLLMWLADDDFKHSANPTRTMILALSRVCRLWLVCSSGLYSKVFEFLAFARADER
jgi:hypothetical protein